jgi:hypothetical protein
MKPIIFCVVIFFATGLKAQIVEEKILEDGTHLITIIPKSYSKEELAQFKPRRIPTTQEVNDNSTLLFSNSCVHKLDTELKIDVEVDSSLADITQVLFEEHVGLLSDATDNNLVSFHQIWTMDDSMANYRHEGFSESFIDMLRENNLQGHFENSKFYCQEFEYNDNYYLVAVLDK